MDLSDYLERQYAVDRSAVEEIQAFDRRCSKDTCEYPFWRTRVAVFVDQRQAACSGPDAIAQHSRHDPPRRGRCPRGDAWPFQY
jgi:hypothetical protein